MATHPGSNRPARPNSRNDFHIAILCALTLEADAVDAVFDFHWDDDGLSFDKTPGDPNAYSIGVIGRHNVVLAYMPGIGVASAASVASACKTSFPNVSLGLVVGICGVVPGIDDDERVLGDIIISEGVVQYDFGRQMDGHFERKSTLLDSFGRPTPDIRAVLAKFRGIRGLAQLRKRIASHLSDLQAIPELRATYPGKANDRLFEPDYKHVDNDKTCDKLGCNGPLVPRKRLLPKLDEPAPNIHFGLIASGSTVMESGMDRDRIAQKEGVIAFEMEAAGAWDSFPCVVIKGACDYADSHKNKLWQRYAAGAGAACMKGFLQEWVPTQTATQISKGPWCLVPYPENESFVQRVSYSKTLMSQLAVSTHTNKVGSRVALYGLGGVGKTQIALSYVHWLQKSCPEVSIFWAHASSLERFLQSYTSIAQECKIPGYDDPKADTLSLVKSWLERTDRGRWLMVIDNADDTELFSPSQEDEVMHASAHAIGRGKLGRFVPLCRHGSILITSRNKQTAVRLAPWKHRIEVRKMTDTEALQLVRSTMEDDDVPMETTERLASRLEHLPLALVQATSFMQENSRSIEDYIQLLDESDEGFINRLSEPFEAFGRDSETSHAVTATWVISFEQIKKQHPFASSVLSMISFLDRQGIPESFVRGYEVLARPDQRKEQSALETVTKALGTLLAFSFVSNGKNETVDMHRLVQLVTRKWLATRGVIDDFAIAALKVVANAFPFGKFETRHTCLQYLPHAYAVLAAYQKDMKVAYLSRALLLDNMGGFFLHQGSWANAEALLSQASTIRAREQGEEHPDTLLSKANLAVTYLCQGRWKNAESLEVQMIETIETIQRVLGKDHRHTLTSKANLASTYWNQGRWKEAESLEVQVADTMQRVLGEEHLDTLGSKINLASTYRSQKRWAEAESLGVQVMETCRRVLGEEHPDTLSSKASLALTYSGQELWKDAESLVVQVTKKRRQVLGEEHPDTLSSKQNLALIYRNLGRCKDAESLEVQVMETKQRVLGEEHPDTMAAMNNLAFTWNYQGRYAEAISLLERCCRLCETVLGSSHHQTICSAATLRAWKAAHDGPAN